MFEGPAIALLEIDSLARGVVVADALVKKAAVRLLLTEMVSPGKLLLLCDGGVAEVEEAFREGIAVAGPTLVDRLFLPQAHPQLASAIRGASPRRAIESLGLVETHSVASALLAADSAVKAAEVALVSMRLARGIGGKGTFTLTGPLHQVEAALGAAAASLAPELLLTTEIVAAPHEELVRCLLGASVPSATHAQ